MNYLFLRGNVWSLEILESHGILMEAFFLTARSFLAVNKEKKKFRLNIIHCGHTIYGIFTITNRNNHKYCEMTMNGPRLITKKRKQKNQSTFGTIQSILL